MGRLPHSLDQTLASPQPSNDFSGRLWSRPLVEGTEGQTCLGVPLPGAEERDWPGTWPSGSSHPSVSLSGLQ